MVASDIKVIQLGQEVTWGTGVAATIKLMGVTAASVTPVVETAQIADIGTLAPFRRSIQTGQSAMATIEMVGTYEDILYPVLSIFEEITPTGSGPYVWAFDAPLAAAPSLQPFTVEHGATGAEYEMTGGMGVKLGIKIDVNDVWRLTWDLVGELLATTTLTAALADRAVEMIRAADTAVYIDAVGGTMGATVVSGTLISADLQIDTKRHLKSFLTDSVNPTTFGEARWSQGPLKLTFEFNATSKAYVDALLSAAVYKQIRIKATSGTAIAQIDFAGTLVQGVELFSDRDGNMIIETTWDGEYNTTYGNWLAISVTNGVATLT